MSDFGSARELAARDMLTEKMGYFRFMSRCDASTIQTIFWVDQIRSAQTHVTKKVPCGEELDFGLWLKVSLKIMRNPFA